MPAAKVVYAALSSLTASGWLAQSYSYAVGSPPVAAPLQLNATPTAMVPASGQEVLYSYGFSAGDARTITGVQVGGVPVSARIAGAAAGSVTVGLASTAGPGAAAQSGTMSLDSPGGTITVPISTSGGDITIGNVSPVETTIGSPMTATIDGFGYLGGDSGPGEVYFYLCADEFGNGCQEVLDTTLEGASSQATFTSSFPGTYCLVVSTADYWQSQDNTESAVECGVIFDPEGGGGPAPVITSVDPEEVTAGTSGTITLRGSNLSGASVAISGTGLAQTANNWGNSGSTVMFSYSAGGMASGARTITVTTAGGSAAGTVTINPPAMQLTFSGTVITPSNDYSEDSTIQVTAVDANHRPITTFTGTVNIAEDGTSVYSPDTNGGCLVYVQNACVTSSSVTISSGGTATFLARSLAGPKTEGQNGAKPDDALIKTTNFPVDGGTSLPVKQWIISNTKIDPLASDPSTTYDWFQYRIKDIVHNATGDLAKVLGKISGYTLNAALGDNVRGQVDPHLGASQSAVVFNALYTSLRLDSYGGQTCALAGSLHDLRNTLYHEARHAYQSSLSNSVTDEDNDGLVNTGQILVAPTNIFVDTTDSRTVCDEAKGLQLSMKFKGPFNPDAWGSVMNSVPGVAFAREMDAATFAIQHESQ